MACGNADLGRTCIVPYGLDLEGNQSGAEDVLSDVKVFRPFTYLPYSVLTLLDSPLIDTSYTHFIILKPSHGITVSSALYGYTAPSVETRITPR